MFSLNMLPGLSQLQKRKIKLKMKFNNEFLPVKIIVLEKRMFSDKLDLKATNFMNYKYDWSEKILNETGKCVDDSKFKLEW